MKPYKKTTGSLKGISGCRRSCVSPHRKRCLRRDKKAARQEVKWLLSLSEE